MKNICFFYKPKLFCHGKLKKNLKIWKMGAKAMKERLFIFDTTLRDGEQSPGAAMTKEEKIRIAKQLEKLGVDVMEAGFAAASPGDFEAIHAIAKVIQNTTVCSLSRANENDIARSAEAIKPAKSGRIHVFLATSPVHMQMKLKMTPDEVVEQAVKSIRYAKKFTDDVEFSAEDAGRSEIDFLCRVFEAAIKAGAKTINVPDTVGYNLPNQYAQTIKTLIERVPNSDQVIWSVHCHNDLGMAVSNSLQAVLAGARQVECTINGLGERAGNTAMEEIVMAIKTRADIFPVETKIDTHQIVPTSKLVSQITGYPVQPNKAIVGANAFAHESGIHQDGVLKCRETYEIMRAEDVGWSQNKLVLGKLSGRNAFKTRLLELGIALESDAALNAAFARFKDLADKKSEIFDEDLHALVDAELTEPKEDFYKLVYSQVLSETGEKSSAKVTILVNGIEKTAELSRGGPVDAIFQAIESIVQSKAELLLYSVNAITTGTDAQGDVTVRLNLDGRIVQGLGADTDIIIASAKAYINALNRLHHSKGKIKAQGMV